MPFCQVSFNGMVFECKSNIHGRCAQSGYQPDEANWDEAWDLLGSCTGTLAPTISPALGLTAAGGCPDDFAAGASYEDGDTVR